MPIEPKYTSQRRTAFHDTAGEDVLQQVEHHWRTMRKGASIPQRIDMTPDAMSGSLTHCFMAERVTPSVLRFRVAGQSLHNLLNMEPRGMPISALFTPTGRNMLAPVIFDTCEGPEISEIPLIAARGLGRSALRARLLLLPLRHEDEAVNRLFGALVVDGKPSRRALRFDFDPEQPVRSQSVQPVIRTIHEAKPTAVPPARPTADHAVTAPRRAKFPALRLVVDNSK